MCLEDLDEEQAARRQLFGWNNDSWVQTRIDSISSGVFQNQTNLFPGWKQFSLYRLLIQGKQKQHRTHILSYASLDGKLRCFPTLTLSSRCSERPAHCSLYLFFTPRCNIYLICVGSAVPGRQRSRKQASCPASVWLDYRWQAECEQDVFCSCSHHQPLGPFSGQ